MASSNSSIISLVIGITAIATTALLASQWRRRKDTRKRGRRGSSASDLSSAVAYEALIGNTPMVHLPKLSAKIGRQVYVKMESLNPGGTGKDRAALGMIRAAEHEGTLPPPYSTAAAVPTKTLEASSDPLDASILQAVSRSRTGGLVVEGTSGSTGIALATLCVARGHALLIVMPDDQAVEKQTILKTLGAVVHVVPNAAISNPNHYVNVARRLAQRAVESNVAAVFCDQFENPANFEVHYRQTGPEVYRECPNLAAFCMSSGTGGTIAGVGRYLKEQSCDAIKVVLVDPPGSALYHKIQHGIAFSPQQTERIMKRHRYDTLAEGIGLDRVTHNLAAGLDFIDEAVHVTDQEAVDMAHWLLQAEGLWVGSSSAMNVVGAVRTAIKLPADSVVATMICDAGQRHVTRFWNRDFVLSWGLSWPGDEERVPECLHNIVQK